MDSDELVMELSALKERLSNWMDTTIVYRKSQCGKMDKIMEHIEKMDERCVNRIVNCEKFAQHLVEHEKNNTFWRDKRLNFVVGAGLLIFGSMLTWVNLNLRAENKLIQKELTNEQKTSVGLSKSNQ